MNKREQFEKELKLLLQKYEVELKVEDHWEGYAECGKDIRITAEFKDWQIGDINLGDWVYYE